MERLPTVAPPEPRVPSRARLRPAPWVRPLAALLVAVLPPLVRAAWQHRAGVPPRRTTARARSVTVEQTELWLERRRFGRTRLHVRATRCVSAPASRERPPERAPHGPRWGTVIAQLVRLVATLHPSGRRGPIATDLPRLPPPRR